MKYTPEYASPTAYWLRDFLEEEIKRLHGVNAGDLDEYKTAKTRGCLMLANHLLKEIGQYLPKTPVSN